MKVPCHECTDRVSGCHDRCPKYAQFKEENRKKKEADREFYSRFGDTMVRLKRDMYGYHKY